MKHFVTCNNECIDKVVEHIKNTRLTIESQNDSKINDFTDFVLIGTQDDVQRLFYKCGRDRLYFFPNSTCTPYQMRIKLNQSKVGILKLCIDEICCSGFFSKLDQVKLTLLLESELANLKRSINQANQSV